MEGRAYADIDDINSEAFSEIMEKIKDGTATLDEKQMALKYSFQARLRGIGAVDADDKLFEQIFDLVQDNRQAMLVYERVLAYRGFDIGLLAYDGKERRLLETVDITMVAAGKLHEQFLPCLGITDLSDAGQRIDVTELMKPDNTFAVDGNERPRKDHLLNLSREIMRLLGVAPSTTGDKEGKRKIGEWEVVRQNMNTLLHAYGLELQLDGESKHTRQGETGQVYKVVPAEKVASGIGKLLYDAGLCSPPLDLRAGNVMDDDGDEDTPAGLAKLERELRIELEAKRKRGRPRKTATTGGQVDEATQQRIEEEVERRVQEEVARRLAELAAQPSKTGQ